MLEYKQSVSKTVPVRIFNASNDPVAGIVFGSVTATVQKADGTTSVVTVTVSDWAETVAGAFSGAGVYTLLLPSGALDQPGLLTYAVATAGNKTFVGAVKVVANEEVDTYTRIGAPVGASISADIANVDSDLATVGSNVTSIASDVTTLISDVANVDSDLATVGSNVLALGADLTSTLGIVETLQKYEEGRWKIHVTGGDANRLVLYDTDNTTPLLKFDLKDSGGSSTFVNPFERVPVP